MFCPLEVVSEVVCIVWQLCHRSEWYQSNASWWLLCSKHFAIVVFRVGFWCCSRSLIVSPSLGPLIIWSLILFCMQLSEQYLHVFVSPLSNIKKLLNNSPGCCILLQKFSFMWLSTYLYITSIIATVSFIWVLLSLRLWMIVRVFLETHSINKIMNFHNFNASRTNVVKFVKTKSHILSFCWFV